MTRTVEDMTWPGGEHDFRLGMGEIEALQQKCDAGPEFILNALSHGTWRQSYVFEVLRLGLIGAGMDKLDARKLIDNQREDTPLRKLVLPAQAVLIGALVGASDDEIEVPGAGEESGVTQPPQTESGDFHKSTDPEQPSDSHQSKSSA